MDSPFRDSAMALFASAVFVCNTCDSMVKSLQLCGVKGTDLAMELALDVVDTDVVELERFGDVDTILCGFSMANEPCKEFTLNIRIFSGY